MGCGGCKGRPCLYESPMKRYSGRLTAQQADMLKQNGGFKYIRTILNRLINVSIMIGHDITQEIEQ